MHCPFCNHTDTQVMETRVLDGGDRLGTLGELGPVGLDELGPGQVPAVEGPPQLGSGGGVLGPLVESGALLGHATGPEPVHQDPCSVLGAGLLTDAFENHVGR